MPRPKAKQRLNNLAKARDALRKKFAMASMAMVNNEVGVNLPQNRNTRKRPSPSVDPVTVSVSDTALYDNEVSTHRVKKLHLSARKKCSQIPNLEKMVEHLGGCHCGAVQFKVLAPENVDVFECNCSICTKKQNIHFIVPKTNFTLLQGKDNLSMYTFNKKLAKHTFCKTCGVQSFYSPRSNPDGVGVMPHCIDSGTIKSVNVKKFDGQNWEDSFSKSNISNYSKKSDEPG